MLSGKRCWNFKKQFVFNQKFFVSTNQNKKKFQNIYFQCITCSKHFWYHRRITTVKSRSGILVPKISKFPYRNLSDNNVYPKRSRHTRVFCMSLLEDFFNSELSHFFYRIKKNKINVFIKNK